MRVLFDTNAILLPFSAGTDLEGELERLFGATEWIVPAPVAAELRGLAANHGAVGRQAKGAIKLLARCRVEETTLPGDDGLLDVARRLGAAVLTNDKKLQAEAARSGLTVIVAREEGRRLALRASGSRPG